MTTRGLKALFLMAMLYTACEKNDTAGNGKNISESSLDSGKIESSVQADNNMKKTGDSNTGAESSGKIALAPASGSQAAGSRKLTADSINRRHNLVSELAGMPVVPEDFEIGPLIDSRGLIGSGNPAAYSDFINRFFREINRGNIPASMIDPESLFFIRSVFRSYIEKQQVPDHVRIGNPVRAGEMLRFNLRMFRGNNRTEGELVATELPGGDIQIREIYGDLTGLEEEYTEGSRKFEPEIYKF